MPVNWDRTIARGQDVVLPLTLPAEDGSGYTYEYTIKARGATSATVTIADANITATFDDPDTSIEIALTDTETTIDATGYLHQLWRIDANNEYPLAEGILGVRESSRE